MHVCNMHSLRVNVCTPTRVQGKGTFAGCMLVAGGDADGGRNVPGTFLFLGLCEILKKKKTQLGDAAATTRIQDHGHLLTPP